MNWICENWYVIIAILCVIIACVCGVIWFLKLPNDKKITNVKRWLEYAVTEAEKALGSKTGQLKLRTVYDLAIAKFPWIATFVSFDTFDEWVKEALLWMEHELETNPEFARYVKGE